MTAALTFSVKAHSLQEAEETAERICADYFGARPYTHTSEAVRIRGDEAIGDRRPTFTVRFDCTLVEIWGATTTTEPE